MATNAAVPARSSKSSNSPTVQDVCARIAAILHEERVAKNLSMTRVAEGAALSRQMVSYVEKGLRIPTVDTLLRITRVLEIDAADVISRASEGK